MGPGADREGRPPFGEGRRGLLRVPAAWSLCRPRYAPDRCCRRYQDRREARWWHRWQEEEVMLFFLFAVDSQTHSVALFPSRGAIPFFFSERGRRKVKFV